MHAYCVTLASYHFHVLLSMKSISYFSLLSTPQKKLTDSLLSVGAGTMHVDVADVLQAASKHAVNHAYLIFIVHFLFFFFFLLWWYSVVSRCSITIGVRWLPAGLPAILLLLVWS